MEKGPLVKSLFRGAVWTSSYSHKFSGIFLVQSNLTTTKLLDGKESVSNCCYPSLSMVNKILETYVFRVLSNNSLNKVENNESEYLIGTSAKFAVIIKMLWHKTINLRPKLGHIPFAWHWKCKAIQTWFIFNNNADLILMPIRLKNLKLMIQNLLEFNRHVFLYQ